MASGWKLATAVGLNTSVPAIVCVPPPLASTVAVPPVPSRRDAAAARKRVTGPAEIQPSQADVGVHVDRGHAVRTVEGGRVGVGKAGECALCGCTVLPESVQLGCWRQEELEVLVQIALPLVTCAV